MGYSHELNYGKVVRERKLHRNPKLFIENAVLKRISNGRIRTEDFKETFGKIAAYGLVQCLERADELLVHSCFARYAFEDDPQRICNPERVTENWSFDYLYGRGFFFEKRGLTMTGSLSYEFWSNGIPKEVVPVNFVIRKSER